MPKIPFTALALFGLALLCGLGAFGLSAASDALDPYAPLALIAAGAFAFAGFLAYLAGRPTKAARSVYMLAASGSSVPAPRPRVAFGEGIIRFVRLEPVRTAMIIRIGFYLITAVVYGTVIDPEFLLESILTAVLGGAADIAKSQDTRRRSVPEVVDYELGKLSAAGQVGAFGANILRSLVPSFLPGATLAKALEIVVPYLGPIASQMMTPELQREVTAKVHQVLRDAGVIRRVDMPATPGG
jgi:hypothetical protein